MRDGYIGTGGIYAIQTALSRAAFYKWRNAMSGENNRPFGDLFQDTRSIWAIECDHTQIGQFFNCMAVMYDLSNNINRPWVCQVFRNLSNNLQCIYHAIAVSARRYFYDFHVFLNIKKSSESYHNFLDNMTLFFNKKGRSHLNCTILLPNLHPAPRQRFYQESMTKGQRLCVGAGVERM